MIGLNSASGGAGHIILGGGLPEPSPRPDGIALGLRKGSGFGYGKGERWKAPALNDVLIIWADEVKKQAH